MQLDPNDWRQMELWREIADRAEAYDDASVDMLAGVPGEIIMAMMEALTHLSPDRRRNLVEVGALCLRLAQDGGSLPSLGQAQH